MGTKISELLTASGSDINSYSRVPVIVGDGTTMATKSIEPKYLGGQLLGVRQAIFDDDSVVGGSGEGTTGDLNTVDALTLYSGDYILDWDINLNQSATGSGVFSGDANIAFTGAGVSPTWEKVQNFHIYHSGEPEDYYKNKSIHLTHALDLNTGSGDFVFQVNVDLPDSGLNVHDFTVKVTSCADVAGVSSAAFPTGSV